MKIRRLSNLRAAVDRASISVNVDTKVSFEEATSQSASQLNKAAGSECVALSAYSTVRRAPASPMRLAAPARLTSPNGRIECVS